MAKEIKIVYRPIELAVSELKTSTRELTHRLRIPVQGTNQLTVLQQLQEINYTYTSLINTYQSLMLQHVNLIEKSIESLQEEDQALSHITLKDVGGEQS